MAMRQVCEVVRLGRRFGRINAPSSTWLCLIVLLTIQPARSQADPGDSLLGKWCTERCDAIFDFYRTGDEYSASLFPQKYPEIIDSINPVDSLKSRRLSGETTIYGLVYNSSKQQWENGRRLQAQGKPDEAK